MGRPLTRRNCEQFYTVEYPIKFDFERTDTREIRKTSMAPSLLGRNCRSSPPMATENRIAFARAVNAFGAFESTCTACLRVISKQAIEADLTCDEGNHRCHAVILRDTLDYFRSHMYRT
jgi:hypothetical protein